MEGPSRSDLGEGPRRNRNYPEKADSDLAGDIEGGTPGMKGSENLEPLVSRLSAPAHSGGSAYKSHRRGSRDVPAGGSDGAEKRGWNGTE